jgi:hypothetical protein
MLAALIPQMLFAGLFVLGAFAFQQKRWAYAAFVLLGVAYFPIRSGFYFEVRDCEMLVDLPLTLYSFTNYSHIIVSAMFFVMSARQFPAGSRSALIAAAVITMSMAVVVEASEATWGGGNCRLRDLIPAATGGLIGAATVVAGGRAARS